MIKRFKSKKKRKNINIKIIGIIMIIYISFNLIYNLIYNFYLKKLSNEEIIEHIINNTKNDKSNFNFLDKYKNPQIILNNEFVIKENENSIDVNSALDNDVLVYIYCTHETESYSDQYLEVYNIKPTVKMMSYVLQDYLIDLGINTIVEEDSVTDVLKSNGWSYKYSYDASRLLVEPTINEYPSLKLIIDLHRDSSNLSKTLLTTDDGDYARILFVVGAEYDGYENNYSLASMLNNLLEEEVSGISRGIIKKSGDGVNGIYNQDLSINSILIELGGQYNEIEELNNSLKVLAKIILAYLEDIE